FRRTSGNGSRKRARRRTTSTGACSRKTSAWWTSSCRRSRRPETTRPRRAEHLNFSYRDDQLLVRDTVRDFVRSRIVPEASGWNEDGEFPLELLPELAALGLTGLAVPHEYGGAELDMLTIALVMEELGAGDGSVALTIAAHNSLCIGHLLIGASEEQKGRWLPPLARGEYLGCWALTEPSSGSDAISVQSRARRDGDDYMVSGTKPFIRIGALAIGLGRASLEIAIGYAKERRQFGRPIADFEMIQWRLARARTELDAARLLVHRAAALADAGLRFTDAASKAKLYASEA